MLCDRRTKESPPTRNGSQATGLRLLAIGVAEEFVEVLADILQCSINQTTYLAFKFVDITFVFRQAHPAKMNGLTHLLVDLRGAKHVAHLVHRVVIIGIEYSHENLLRLGRTTEGFYDTALNEASDV